MFWGFSEGLNFYEEYRKHIATDDAVEINVLLYGLGDPRHILTTASKMFLHNTQINFHIVEGCLELVARNILLLTIAFEDGEKISVRGKTHLYMDVFGNSLMRPFSNSYVNAKAKELSKMVTDDSYLEGHAPMFDFSRLKYKERDQLDDIFRFWINRPEHIFNIAKYWDDRLRMQHRERYDHRAGAFDWDLHMKLRENGAKQICPQEYKHWRETGIAFIFPEFEQSDPNKTFAVGLCRNGNNYRHRGIAGDGLTGPFISYGIKCAEEKLMHSKHGVNDFRATDVTERNVYELMFEIQEKEQYEFNPKHIHQYGAHQLDPGKNLNKELPRSEPVSSADYNRPLIPCDRLKIYFHSVEDVLRLPEHTGLHRKFNIVSVASNYFALLKDNFSSLWTDPSLVCFETRQLTTFSKEEIIEFNEQIKSYAKNHTLSTVTSFNINKGHSILRFKCDSRE